MVPNENYVSICLKVHSIHAQVIMFLSEDMDECTFTILSEDEFD